MQDASFEIKLPLFEGPFDLLLFFIERDEIAIEDIEISKITDDFLQFIKQMNALNVEIASEFIYTAATLMRIKARTLLPRPEVDEEGNEIDLKRNLVQQLILYKQFKDISVQMQSREQSRSLLLQRGHIDIDLAHINQYISPSDALQSFDLYKLLTTYQRVMGKFEQRKVEVKHTVVQYPYTIEIQKKAIQHLISLNEKIDCTYLLKNADNKVHFVYNFLAVLELLQQQELSLHLGEGFNNFWVSASVPPTHIPINSSL